MNHLHLTPQKLAYSVEAFCELVGLGRTSAYAELKSGRLKKVKVGNRTLIPASEALAWLERLSGGLNGSPVEAPVRA